MKKILLSLLTILMCITSVPVYAEDSETPITETSEEHEHNHEHEEVPEETGEEISLDESTLIVEESHSDVEELVYYCDKEEHIHDDSCYEIYSVLTCSEEHEHSEECFKEYRFLICEKEEHFHIEECLNPEYEEIVIEEEPSEFEINLQKAINNEDNYYLSCEQEEHSHTPECFELVEDLICENVNEEHTHDENCFNKYYKVVCEKEEHAHTEECVSIREVSEEESIEYIDEIPDDLPKDEDITEETPLRFMLRAPLRAGSNETQIEVRSLNVQVFYGGQWQDNNTKYVKTVKNSIPGQRFAFRINFALSGVGEIDPYTEGGEGVKITIPKQILRNRVGDLADKYEMSIPHISEIEDEEMDVDINYCYYEEGDNIVIVNFKERPAGDNGYIEIAYATDQSTFNYQDMGVSDDFYATIDVTNNEQTLEPVESNRIPVYINTTAKIDSTSKSYPTKYDTWQSSWGTKPADADDYFYLTWDIVSYINDNATQPYNLTFTDTTTSDYGVSEFVGYKTRGTGEYITDNTSLNQIVTGRRYDSVLTRHLKSDFDPLDYYKIINNIKVVLTPADLLDQETSASATKPYEYTYHVPVWRYPSGHFQVWKYADGSYRAKTGYSVLNEKRGKYSRYDLQDWKDNTLDIYDTFDWGVVILGYPYPWTISEGADPQDVSNYGVTPVTFETSDNTLFFGEENTRKLTYEDYEIDTLNYSWTKTKTANIEWKEDNHGDIYPYYQTSSPAFDKETDVIYFYAELEGSGNYVLCATHDLRDNSTWFDSNYVSNISESTHDSYQIVFVDNITGYKVKYDSAYYYTNIELNLNAHLKHSNYVDTYCADKSSIMWANTARGEFFDNRGAEPVMVFSGDRTDWNYASETVIERDVWINKKPISATNIVKKKQYAIGWEVEMDERMKINDEPWEDVIQEGGTFYDLLPSGASLDTRSVAVKVNGQYYDGYSTQNGRVKNGSYLKENEYSVSTISNYNDTGRTLLIVTIPGEANNYAVTYDTIHPWDSIKDFGNDVYNPVAYETRNDKIYKGSNNDGGNLKEKDLMSNLGNNGNSAPKFIYSEAEHDIVALTSAVSGLTKKVKDENDISYTYDTFTKNNGSYSYRLRYQNTFNNTAKNLIFFDSLENYIVDSNESDWRGSIESFDVSQLKSMGIEPVIYVSTIPYFDLEQYSVLTNFDDVFANSGDWIKFDNYSGNLSDIKACAIDCRKKTDGNDFVLDEGQSIQATIYMRAPAGADDIYGTGTDYPETYNNIYIRNTITGQDGTPVDFYIHQDYTTVRFVVKNDISLEKVSSENEDIKLADIKFRLTGISDYGTNVDIIKSTDRYGQIKFEDIEKGSYILQEYETTKDWLLDTTEHIVRINSDGTVTINGDNYTNVATRLTNNPRIYSEIFLMKRREGDSADDIETKQMLASAEIGDKVTYNDKEYIVTDKTNSKVKLEEPFTTKYAVQIYGIEYDTLEDGSTAGLTFGPAMGQDFINTYISHTPSGTTSSGNNHRCVHDDDWETIIRWNSVDPYVYEQCIAEGCTHSIKLSISNTLKTPEFIYGGSADGDGVGALYYEMLNNARIWNAWGSFYGGTGSDSDYNNTGGWGASNIRAVLNGVDSLTTVDTFAEANNISTNEALISAFPTMLQNAIGARKTLYDTAYDSASLPTNTKTTYDKLWLLSPNELSDELASYKNRNHPLEAPNGKYYKFNSINLQGSQVPGQLGYAFKIFRASNTSQSVGETSLVSLRSITFYRNTNKNMICINYDGGTSGPSTDSFPGVSPCFSLNKNADISGTEQDKPIWVDYTIKPQAPISDTTFKLSGTSDYGNEANKILTTDSSGRLVFDDIEKGTYELREAIPNPDFILNETVWTVVVGEDRSITVTSNEENRDRLYEVGSDDSGRYNVVYNEPRYWNFTLRKIDKENETIWLQGATFSLKGISDLGTEYDLEVESNENGRVIFNRIEKGTYLLTETQAPSGVDEEGKIGGNRNYIADSKQYIVKIDNQGNVSIDGLSQNDYDDFEVKNDRALDGKITIIKKWVDTDPSKRVAPVVHLSTGEPEGLAKAIITYDANSGAFENSNINKVLYRGTYSDGTFTSTSVEGQVVEPTKSGHTFEGWYLDKEFTIPYDSNISDGQPKTVYAKWEGIKPFAKYAVSLMGICVDVDENGDTMGLTFGPATGDDPNKTWTKEGATDPGYVNAYKSHTPTGTTTNGNAHRCLHDDDWTTIIHWNNVDPYVYEQCINENCTHSVDLYQAGETIANPKFKGVSTGDGPSVLVTELWQYQRNGTTVVYDNLRWHPNNNMPNNTSNSGTSYGGWGASRIRAMLNGADSLTDLGDGTATKEGGTDIYSSDARTDNHKSASIYTETNNLLTTFPQELQNAIGKRATKYDSVYNSKTEKNLKISYDELWFLSPNEIWNTSQNADSYYAHPLEGNQYARFANGNSGTASSSTSQDFTRGYYLGSETATAGSGRSWWLRSSSTFHGSNVLHIPSFDGYISNDNACNHGGVSPCFSLSR